MCLQGHLDDGFLYRLGFRADDHLGAVGVSGPEDGELAGVEVDATDLPGGIRLVEGEVGVWVVGLADVQLVAVEEVDAFRADQADLDIGIVAVAFDFAFFG